MTSNKAHRRLTTCLAAGGVALLVTLIVVLWVYVGQQSPRGALPPGDSASAPPAAVLKNTISTNAEKTNEIPTETPPSHVTGYSQDVDTELVRLQKISPPPVHGHDAIFDHQSRASAPQSDQINGEVVQKSPDGEKNENESTLPLHHDTGHFRHLHTEVWDPHPQYIVSAFGKSMHLVLKHNAHFLRVQEGVGPPTGDGRIEVTHVFRNYTKRVKAHSRPTGCFYTGKIKDEPESNVAVSLCGGMTGYIHSARDGTFYIEPAEVYDSTDAKGSLLHRMHRIGAHGDANIDDDAAALPSMSEKVEGQSCETGTNSKIIFDDFTEDINNGQRTKRDTWTNQYPEGAGSLGGGGARGSATYQNKNREYFIETLVVADKKMAEYHRTDEQLIHYILTLMSHVALLYKDATIGNPVSVCVVHIMVLNDHEFVSPHSNKHGHVNGVNSAEMLRQFCKFQHKVNGDDGTVYHHDTALLLTRETICRNTQIVGQYESETLGLAELGSMCAPRSSCAIIKDKGLPTSYTIAHELGHVLSMPHDDDVEKCARFNTQHSDMNYIMGRVSRNDTLPWWSHCSKRYLTDFLESKRARCLYDLPSLDLLKQNTTRNLPGETFDADAQCEMIFGNGLKLCSNMSECRHLFCQLDPKMGEGCITHYQPWADGTPCRNDAWCHRGACVPRDPHLLTPVAGGWGRWRKWGSCSRSCGGGIWRAERECDSPRPQNGGPYCIGPSVRYGSCNTDSCPEDDVDFRESQCADFNGNSRGIPGLRGDVKWVPKYNGIEPEETCKLYCRVQHSNQHYLLAERVKDGTKCGLNSFDVCVNGACRSGGCDNRLDSNLALDACGICGGDNSLCEQVEGTFNAKPTYGYSKVLRIPKGSSNLDVRQHAHVGDTSSRDGNYLALVDSETGLYVLNGGEHVSSYTVVFMYGGVTLEYTGANADVERINSSGSVRLQKDLLVELLSVDRQLPPNITYTYMMVRGSGPRYTWQLFKHEWGACSHICSGVRRPIPRCVYTATAAVVSDRFCEHLDRDLVQGGAMQCNTHCRLAWRIKLRHACSAHCGPGVRTILHQCVQINNTLLAAARKESSQEFAYLERDEQEEEETTEEDEDLNAVVPWAIPVDDKHCANLNRPSNVEKCEGTCESTRWYYEDWTECSKTCGSGIQTRSFYCVDSAAQKIDAAHCRERPSPVQQQTCNTHKCPTWSVDEWTPCSVTCGRGYRTKPYHCHMNGRVLRPEACDASKVPVVREPCEGKVKYCTHWVTSDWFPSKCPCHIHVQKRSVTCRPLSYRADRSASMFGEPQPLNEADCAGLLKPNDTRPCLRHENDLNDCIAAAHEDQDNHILPELFEWRSGPWSDCSRSCGGGTKSRNVVCQNKAGIQREDHCDPKIRHVARVQCNMNPCPKWNHGEWSSCNSDCRRNRLVICQDHLASRLTEDHCSKNDRPMSEIKCVDHPNCYPVSRMSTTTSSTTITTTMTTSVNSRWNAQSTVQSGDFDVDVFHHVKWKMGLWSPCSKSCGRGQRMRHISCLDIRQNVTLVEHFCRALRRPKTQKDCYRSECAFAWQEGPWTPCSKSCDEGVRYRNITCHRVLGHGRTVHREPLGGGGGGTYSCDPNTKPSNYETCVLRYCDEPYYWVSGSWKDCSQSCGPKGRQTRHLYCHHNGKKVPKKHCPIRLRPPRKQKCNQKRCTAFRSCTDVKQALQTAEDRDYDLLVSNARSSSGRGNRRVLIKVFCFAMETHQPKEYLSLPDDGRENYAEVYDKRLIDPETCPFGGHRNDLCDCMPSDSKSAGLTLFYKVRFNITTMKIIGDDFTFSRQNKGNQVAYGTAGDCYSRRDNCPQGRFSINLRGTGLRLSRRVRWVSDGMAASLAVSPVTGAVVSGKCGGYCGRCEPDSDIGLLVEPDLT